MIRETHLPEPLFGSEPIPPPLPKDSYQNTYSPQNPHHFQSEYSYRHRRETSPQFSWQLHDAYDQPHPHYSSHAPDFPAWRERSPEQSFHHCEEDWRSGRYPRSSSPPITCFNPELHSNEWINEGHSLLHPQEQSRRPLISRVDVAQEPLFNVNRESHRPMRKIVPAETVFDSPGRKDRPSHVRVQST